MKSNTKEVSKKIQEHILDYYSDYEDSPIQGLIHDIGAVKYGDMSDIQGLAELVKGGQFLIYDDDIVEFLNELGINPKNKHYPIEKSRQVYTALIVREGMKLIYNFVKGKQSE